MLRFCFVGDACNCFRSVSAWLLSFFRCTVIFFEMLSIYLFLSLSWAECRWYQGCQVFCSPPIFNYKSLIVDKVQNSRSLDLGRPLSWQRSSRMSCPSLLIGDANVPKVTSGKSLGVHIDKTLTWDMGSTYWRRPQRNKAAQSER